MTIGYMLLLVWFVVWMSWGIGIAIWALIEEIKDLVR